jgi:precorrin-4 methylase
VKCAGVVALAAALILGACAEQREEIVETNVPLYMEAGVAASAAPAASAGGDARVGGGERDR